MPDFDFLGRQPLVDSLWSRVASEAILLEGGRGVGKSRILTHLDHQPKAGWAVLRFDLQGVTDAAGLVARMEEHVELRRGRVQDWLSSLLIGTWRRADPWDSLEQLLHQRGRDRCLLLLDEVQIYLDDLSRRDPERAALDLRRLDGLCRLPDARVLLCGSISLRAVARHLGHDLNPAWTPIPVPPLAMDDACSLFFHLCPGACDDATMQRAAALAGAYPRWIERLAGAIEPGASIVGASELDAAIRRVMAQGPFETELHHLRRHKGGQLLGRALRLAAEPGANRLAVLTALQSDGTRREDAVATLDVLRDEHFIDEEGQILVPLLAHWLRRSK